MGSLLKAILALSAAAVLSACGGKAVRDGSSCRGDEGSPVMMLRLRMPNTAVDENWAALLSGLKKYPRCCDEIWFSTGTGVPSMDVHREHVERLREAKEDLRRLSIGTSVQIQATIGHGDSVTDPDFMAGKTWTGWTGSTGVEDVCCNCPRQPEFLEYIRQMTRLYASLRPRVMWIDDDLRYDNHYPASAGSRPGCWCERCIADFSETEGRAWTRESLDRAMASDKELEERWKAFSISSLDRIARIVSEETMAVSPGTRMGYQKTYSDRDTTVVRTILGTMAEVSGRKVSYRAGGGAYYDRRHPAAQIIKSMRSARYMRVLGCADIVESWCPEIESWPRHYGSRTAQSVLLEDFAALAYGLDAVSMFVLDNGEEPFDLQARVMLRPLHEGAPVLEAYARANAGTVPAGYTAPAGVEDLFEFGTLGIPVLPGLGKDLGRLSAGDMKGVSMYSQPSSDVQAFRDALDSRSPAPAKYLSPFVGLVAPRVDAGGKLRTLGLVNCRIDAQQSIRFALPSLDSGTRKAVWRELRRPAVRLRIERGKDGTAFVEVPSVAAWNAGFIEFK